ncbi:glycosyltransferase family protein [Pontibacter russatus]|uniref:glycosyltransferase family 4 protein n=1 Tax=Pontibacter russatus TaxID=2694929 RepID=UPI0013799EFC|nr:glycosyltransferase family 4 protein [Pontibacter russatus]
MSEKRILIASLLKPINDTRMYEKLGLSLGGLPQAQVHIAGYDAPAPTDAPPNIAFHPIFQFSRLSVGRAAAQIIYYRLLLELRPHLLIVCTHELLPASYLYSRRNPCLLIYDVQENYTLNLTSQGNYPPLLRKLLAWGVGGIEKSLARHIAHFFVAERSYIQELPFLGRYTLLENKHKPAAGYRKPETPVQLQHTPLRLLYSGTIARLYGIFEAIALAEKLHQLEPQTTLTIIGYSPDNTLYKEVLQQVQARPYICLIGGNSLVPHQRIVQAIAECNIGLLPYRPHTSTFRCIPTKLFEYAAHALPMVVQHNPLWHDFLQGQQAGLSIDFATTDAAALLRQIRGGRFYEPGVPSGVFWDSEERKLLAVAGELLSRRI